MDDDRIWSKTAPLSFENGLVWTGPEIQTRCDFEASLVHNYFLLRLACVASVSVEQRAKNGVFRVLPTRKCGESKNKMEGKISFW